MRIVLIFLLLFSAQVPAATELEQLLGKMQKKYENLDTLKASFTQSYQSKKFSDRLVEKGQVHLRKGGLMKWEYQEPEKKVFYSDGQYYFYYVPEDKQVVKAPIGSDRDERSPMLYLVGRGNFLKDFKAEWADPRPGSHLIKLIPVKHQPDFQYLIVQVDPVTGLILRLLVVDGYDNRTEYTFQSITENPKIPENFFAFQPPRGVDVIFQREQSE